MQIVWIPWREIVLAVALAGCASTTLYRDDARICRAAEPEVICARASLQTTAHAASRTVGYSLAFLEFGDDGQLLSPAQLQLLLHTVREAWQSGPVLLVVFAHGWQHSAAFFDSTQQDDAHVRDFRALLHDLAWDPDNAGRREVVGVYLGWRGATIGLPVFNLLSFWDRREAAEQIGRAGGRDALGALFALRHGENGDNLQMALIGHSFGARLLHAALGPELLAGANADRAPSSYQGDVMLWIDPAIEDASFEDLRRHYRGQEGVSARPMLAVIASRADGGVRFAFAVATAISGSTSTGSARAGYLPVGSSSHSEVRTLELRSTPAARGADGAGSPDHAWTLACCAISPPAARDTELLELRVFSDLLPEHGDFFNPDMRRFLREFILSYTS